MNKKIMILIILVVALVTGWYFVFKPGQGTQAASIYQLPFSTSLRSLVSIKKPVGKPISCSFTQKTPKVQVLTPNGGEVYTLGQQVLVKWQTCNWDPQNTIQIGFYSAVYNQAQEITLTNNDGQEWITLPSTFEYLGVNPLVLGKYYKIRLALNGNPNLADSSDDFFSIYSSSSSTSTSATTSSVTSTNTGSSTSGTTTSSTTTSGTTTSSGTTTQSGSSSSASGSRTAPVSKITR